MRRARFQVQGEDFDGASTATVTIEQEGPHVLIRVKPFRRRREYVLPLSAVAAQVVWTVCKAEARQTATTKLVKRSVL